jgi:hypothetical protein
MRNGSRALPYVAAIGVALFAGGCMNDTEMKLRDENTRLAGELDQTKNQLTTQRATIDELNKQLDAARGITPEELKKIYYPKEIVIDRLSGGYDSDGKPGDDGVAVYLRPIDQYGDIIKAPGEVRIQLFDLAAPPGRNQIGEYVIPVEELGPLWHGRFLTNHYTIKCPWPSGPPEHNEITIRVTFVDYLTKRVVSAQSTGKVKLPP